MNASTTAPGGPDMTADTVAAAALPKPPSMKRLIVAATISNVFEWFDFVVYGFFAVTLAEVFFPAGNPTVSLLVTFGAFGLALYRAAVRRDCRRWVYRPRRPQGWPPAVDVADDDRHDPDGGDARVRDDRPCSADHHHDRAAIAGFSVGGEYGSAVTFLAEHGGARRGFSASWQFATGGIITALVSIFGVTLTTLLTYQELVDWGWRIPYFFGMLIGPAGLYVRSKVVDTPEFIEAEKPATIPITCSCSGFSACWPPSSSIIKRGSRQTKSA